MRFPKPVLYLLAAAPLLGVSHGAYSSEGVRVFYLDRRYEPVVRLDRLPARTPVLDGILAMYALQNGAGCSGHDKLGLRCKLTESLGLGYQCSNAHIALVRRTFPSSLPPMSGYRAQLYQAPWQHGTLESICYALSDSTTGQTVWTMIRIGQTAKTITVDARGSWLTPDESRDFAYSTVFAVEGDTASVLTHRIVPTKGGRQRPVRLP